MAKKRLNIKVEKFTDLTDAQWAMIQNIVDSGRKIKKDLRMVVNGILKITRTGSQWRNIDEKYGPWQSLYYYFRKWTKNAVFDSIIIHLVSFERVRQGRKPQATAGAIDSQSVKKVGLISLNTGLDGNKCINGRKRNIVVDTLGLPLAIYVCAAHIHDSVCGIELLPTLDKTAQELKLIRADSAYKGEFVTAAGWCGYTVEISQKPPSGQGFVPQRGRWQVERSFAWENFFRRLSKDYEKTVASSVSFIQLAFCSIILARVPN
jgi:putative transposase